MTWQARRGAGGGSRLAVQVVFIDGLLDQLLALLGVGALVGDIIAEAARVVTQERVGMGFEEDAYEADVVCGDCHLERGRYLSLQLDRLVRESSRVEQQLHHTGLQVGRARVLEQLSIAVEAPVDVRVHAQKEADVGHRESEPVNAQIVLPACQ